jgi:energy-coupling factor transporter ATP-binding protein EcfA2
MKTVSAPAAPEEIALPFPSLGALRSVHSDLLKRQQAGGSSPELLDAAETFVRRGRETGALLDSQDDRWSAQSALDYWSSALYRLAGREVDSTLAEFDPGLAPTLDEALRPYVGLAAFQEGQHELFFGRSRLLGEMVSRLRESRLLAVLGPSGSGKSSLVLGGLLPALRAGAVSGSEGWSSIQLVPGSEPLRNLARALLPAGADPEPWISRQAEALERDPEHLARLLAEQSDAPAVLVIDQFEEVFTLCEPLRIRQAFIAGLVQLLRSAAPEHRVVLTMRSDYEAYVSRLEDLQPFFEDGQIRVTPLSAAELRDAIEKPAEKIGLKFEDGLVPALLADLLGEPAGLPLLQFTLLKLWEHRERNRVTWAAYRRLGGGRRALAQSADELYNSLIEQDQRTARRILLRMVRPGSGLDVTSNRIRRAALQGIGGDVDRVLDSLVEGRLVRLTPGETPDDTQVEVAHEALVRNWPRLVDWLEEARAEMTTRRRLEAQAAEWTRLGCGSGGLLDAVQLAEAERWLASPEAQELGTDQQLAAFVAASRQAVDRAVRGRRWKGVLLWVLPVFLVLYALAWALFVRELKRSRILHEAQVEVETLRAERERLETEKQNLKSETERLAADNKKAADQVRLALGSAKRISAEAAKVIAEAKRKESEAKAARARAETAIRNADIRISISQGQVDHAEKEASAKQRAADAAGEALLAAQFQQFQAIDQRKQTLSDLAVLEKTRKQAEEHSKNLENEIADGGASHDETVPWLLKRTWDAIRKMVELAQFRNRLRPVLAGGSTSTVKGLAGTICCVVHDDKDTYLLSRMSVYAGAPRAPVLQPSLSEGPLGTRHNVVATLVRHGNDPHRSGAIARLNHEIGADPAVLKLGKITGIAERPEIAAGTPVRMAGAGSGKQDGKILRFEDDGTIVTDLRPVSGDSGAPIVTLDHRIIGMLWGWGTRGREAYAVPIRKVLDELKVELGPRPAAP